MKIAGIPAKTIAWTGRRSDPAGAWKVWSWLRKHPAQIVHLHHGGLATRAVCRMAGARVVVQHVHSRILESDGTSASRLRFRMADAVIANSRAVADCLRGFPAEVIYPGVETESNSPIAVMRTSRSLKIGVLSRLVPLKNVEAVIRAAARLLARGIDVRVEIAGSGPLESSLHDLIASLKVKESVKLLGWQVGVRELLNSWDLLVVPSLEEGFGFSALEAMAAARPVLASKVGGLSELVVDGLTGRLVAPGDTDALVDCIADFALNREQLALMGSEGWKRAQIHFSTDLMARRTAELYGRLLNRRNHRAI
jgi:glycosyltransferase involved in cell wall biosynthesis